jgi:hypothetical protein
MASVTEGAVEMSELEPVARVVRWGVESMAFNLGQLPADKLDWKPNPACKSAMEVTGEVLGVMQMMVSVLEGGEPRPPADATPEEGRIRYATPATLEEAQRRLLEAGQSFADALEKAGPELERAVPTPFGMLWGPRLVLWGMIDLVHHHGQIAYLQCLLGDGEMHMNTEGRNWFGVPE